VSDALEEDALPVDQWQDIHAPERAPRDRTCAAASAGSQPIVPLHSRRIRSLTLHGCHGRMIRRSSKRLACAGRLRPSRCRGRSRA
jgi:hypothetical protein